MMIKAISLIGVFVVSTILNVHSKEIQLLGEEITKLREELNKKKYSK